MCFGLTKKCETGCLTKFYVSGTKENSRYRSFEVDRRCTYTPLPVGEDESISSTVYGKLKQLEYVSLFCPIVLCINAVLQSV